MSIPEETPNWESSKARHKRVFAKTLFTGKAFFSRLIKRRPQNTYVLPEEQVGSTSSRFFRQLISATIALLLLTSFSPGTLLETGVSADFLPDSNYLDDPLEEGQLFADDEGFILKTNPQNEEVNRLGFTDKVYHAVTPGETLSQVAQRYDLNVKTLMWENNLTDGDFLKTGQTLIVPAVDGVSHTAKTGETLNQIAKQYSVDPQVIVQHNHLEGEQVQKGEALFIPGGEKPEPPPSPSRGGTVRTFENRAPTIASDNKPEGGKPLIFPTDGQISQGFRGGHYGVDISNRSKPDVWAAASGKVIEINGGCPSRENGRQFNCGHGYGNNVVISHANGLETRYAHLETIYVVEGQEVSQGQLLGKMGNSGRVYGPTGIHVHFEVSDNGVKKNPSKYY